MSGTPVRDEKLLVVDDDIDLCSMLREFLQEAGFRADFESDGARGIARMQNCAYALLILDVMLPGLNGFDVLRRIRQHSQLPVMMLTAKSGSLDRIQGFDSGADDYLTKPFHAEELLARIRAILRRSKPLLVPPKEFRVGALTLLPGSRCAYYDGRPLDLTAMECEILEQLFRVIGKVVSRDQLSLQLYNRLASPYDRSIDTHVSRIRRKLGSGRNLIRSVRGTGYQLCDHPESIASC